MNTTKKQVPPALKRFSATVLMAFVLLSTLSAQIKVTGTVTSAEDGMTLLGANVTVKGTDTGAFTDIDGKYAITVPSGDAILHFSYVGMQDLEIAVGGRSLIDVVMQPDAMQLTQAIVVGFGVQKKVNLSGAVDNLSTDQLNSRPLSNLSQGLQGVSPNLNIDFNSGAPGQTAKINIRGLTSINGGEPLILVDGVPSDAAELNRIAPEDVESISVLKDASSAAIYGARAAYGVILITTKKGAQEGVQVSYSANLSAGTPTITPDKITDPYIYLRVLETSTDNTPWDNQNFSDETYAWAKERSDNPASSSAVRENPNAPGTWEYMGDRDWTDYFLDNYNLSQNHNIGISGSSKTAQYYLSGAYNRSNGALSIADDYFDRYGMRAKVNFDVADWLSVGNNTYLTSTDRVNPTYFSIWDIYNFHPFEYDKNPDDTWANTEVGRMGAKLTGGGMSEDRYNSFQTTFTGEIRLIKDLLRVNADYTTRRGDGDFNSYTTKYQIGFGPEDVREEGVNAAYRTSTKDIYNVFNVYGTLDKQIGASHHLTAIAGFNQEAFRTEWFSVYRDGIISASLPSISLATGDPQADEYIAEWAVRGAFGRINYILLDRYIVELNGRYDGSSRFPKDKRFGFFPSASVAWNVTREGFMSSIDETVSLLKLRASYGSLGNQFVSEYGYIPTMNAVTGNYIIGDRLPQRVTPPGLVSPNYTWEDVISSNFGADLGLFRNSLMINFDLYRRDTKGMLTLGKDLPDVLGAPEPAENAADLKTTGWEAALTYRNSIRVADRPLEFDIRLNLSDSRSYITRFDNPGNNLTQYYEGMELGEIWGLTSDGLFQSQAEIDALDETAIIPWGALAIVPGWPKFVDQDGNGKIEKGLTLDDTKDLSVIGNMLPRYRYGMNLGLSWIGFDFNIFFQGVGKRDYYPLDYLYWGFYQQPYAGGYEHLLDYYRGADDSPVNMAKHSQAYIDAGLAYANPDAYYPVLQAWLADRNLGERIDEAQGLAIPQTRYMLNAAYLRLKNLTLGYSLPASVLKKARISSLRFFVSGENITEWSEVARYFDPEAISDVDSRINPAISPDRSATKGYVYPFQRRYSVGLNVTF